MDKYEGALAEALRLMELALARLDSIDSALVVGAHLDLAICNLRDLLGSGFAGGAH